MISGYWINGTSEEAERKRFIGEIQKKYSEQRRGTEVYQFPEGFITISENWSRLFLMINPNYNSEEPLSDKEESALVEKIKSLGFECTTILEGARV